MLDAALAQRNMRLHLVAAVLVAAIGSAFPLGAAEQLALILCVFLVLAAEMANTALEAAVDLVAGGPDERARRAKDAAAGSVLVLAVGAAAVFALVVSRNWEVFREGLREAGIPLGLGLGLAALSAFLVFPFRRPRWLNGVAALGGAVLLVLLAVSARGLAFSAVGGLAFAVCAWAAFARRAIDRAGPRRPAG